VEINEYIDLFYFYLSNYKEKLIKIKEGSKEKGQCGYYPFSPLISRTYGAWVLNFLITHKVDTSKLEIELREMDKDLLDYIKGNRTAYFENVYCDFKLLVKNYNMDGILESGYSFETTIIDRTYIEMFSKELENSYDIADDMNKVRKLDEVLKAMVKDAVIVKTYSPKDKPFAPREYWWLHLEDKYGKPEEIID
jgi:hypothetical protein